MGTKNNPGKIDCYANAEGDEPLFILLGRDRFAGSLIRLWVKARLGDGESAPVLVEAMDIADAMDAYCRAFQRYPKKEPTPVLNLIPTEHLEAELKRRQLIQETPIEQKL